MHCGSSDAALIYMELDLVNSAKVIDAGCGRQLVYWLEEGLME